MEYDIGYVYFIGQKDECPHYNIDEHYRLPREYSFVKIGYSINPKKRLKSLQTSNPHKLEIIGCIKLQKEGEKMIHQFFKDLFDDCCVRGEWFKWTYVKHYISMWIPYFEERPENERTYDNYAYFYEKFIKKYERNFSDYEDRLISELGYLTFRNKGWTKSRKFYIDCFGDLIFKNMEYYAFNDVIGGNDKISQRSLKMFFSILDELGIKFNFKNRNFNRNYLKNV